MDRNQTPTPAAWAGIDVSKDTLDACLLPGPAAKGHARAFPNDAAGHAALAAWADGHAAGAAVGFGLESTGAYGEALATSLADAGRHVAVVNPARVKSAGLMRGQGNKTDRPDARLIAEYAHASGLTAGSRRGRKSASCRPCRGGATTCGGSRRARRPASPPPA